MGFHEETQTSTATITGKLTSSIINGNRRTCFKTAERFPNFAFGHVFNFTFAKEHLFSVNIRYFKTALPFVAAVLF